MTDLKKALITGDGKWLSTGVSKNGVTTAQYAYFDEMYGWNDIDLYVPFVAPIPTRQWDICFGEHMISQSAKEKLPDLEKAYKKLVNDQTIADSTIAAFAKIYEKEEEKPMPAESAYVIAIERVMLGLFQIESYGDFATWTKLIPTVKLQG